jgi:hypothetical protein
VLVAVVIALWVGWRVLPSLLQKAAPLVEVACGSASGAAAAEATFTVGCAPVAPTVDGEFDDWRSVPSHGIDAVVASRGAVQPGLAGAWQALWDKDALFIRVQVRDGELRAVNPSQPKLFWQGDGVSFEFGPDPRGLSSGAPLRRGRDLHVMFGVVEDGDRGAIAAVNEVGSSTFSVGSLRPEITVVRRAAADGYELEARVPWTELGLTVPPARGSVVAMNVNISDARPAGQTWGLRTMLSSNPARDANAQNHPARWQTVVLGDSA